MQTLSPNSSMASFRSFGTQSTGALTNRSFTRIKMAHMNFNKTIEQCQSGNVFDRSFSQAATYRDRAKKYEQDQMDKFRSMSTPRVKTSAAFQKKRDELMASYRDDKSGVQGGKYYMNERARCLTGYFHQRAKDKMDHQQNNIEAKIKNDTKGCTFQPIYEKPK